MLTPVISNAFKKDTKKLQKSGKDMSKLRIFLTLLIEEQSIPQKYKDHSLKGNLSGYRDAHIEPDWIIIYQIIGDELHLVRTGTHSELF